MGKLSFPSHMHESALNKVTRYFKSDPRVFAVLLMGSLARGQGSIGSSIDLVVFIDTDYMKEFFKTEELRRRATYFEKMGGKVHRIILPEAERQKGKHASTVRGEYEGEYGIDFDNVRVDLVYKDGFIRLKDQLGICLDNFEPDVGNYLAYCVLLYERDDTYKSFAKKYLPFYDEEIRRERLEATRKEFDYRIWEAKQLAEKGVLFNSLSTLLLSRISCAAFFLQHLFIKKRKYPISYRKWLKYQIVDMLHEPELYEKLTQLFTIERLSGEVLRKKADFLHNLMEEYGA